MLNYPRVSAYSPGADRVNVHCSELSTKLHESLKERADEI